MQTVFLVTFRFECGMYFSSHSIVVVTRKFDDGMLHLPESFYNGNGVLHSLDALTVNTS